MYLFKIIFFTVTPLTIFCIIESAVPVVVFRLLRFQCDVIADVFTADTAIGEVEARRYAVIVGDGIAFFILVFVVVIAVEQAEADGIAMVIEPRMSIGEGIVVIGIGFPAEFPVDGHFITGTAEIAFR